MTTESKTPKRYLLSWDSDRVRYYLPADITIANNVVSGDEFDKLETELNAAKEELQMLTHGKYGTIDMGVRYALLEGRLNTVNKERDQAIAQRDALLSALKLARSYVHTTECVIPRDSLGKNLVSPDLEKVDAAIAFIESSNEPK